jgi:hypothetical protein
MDRIEYERLQQGQRMAAEQGLTYAQYYRHLIEDVIKLRWNNNPYARY